MRKNKRIFVLVALLFSFQFFSANQVLAKENAAEVPLTVKQSFEVKNPEKKIDLTGHYELRALEGEVPMPENTKENVYSFSLTGEKTEMIISLRYLHAGVYRYQLSQMIKEKEGYQYDKSCYEVTVYVENDANGTLIPQVIAEKEDGKKYGELEFQNSYLGKESEMLKPEKPNKQENPEKQDRPKEAVKTGDTANVAGYMTAMLLAGSIAMLMMNRKWKRR